MNRRRLRNNGERPKEFWGAVVGGLIGAGASLFGAKMSGDAAVDSAQAQAEAIKEQTQEQAKVIREQISNDNKLFNQSQALTKQIHEEDKMMRRAENFNTLSLQSQENNINRDEAAKFKFAKGGIISKRRLRNAGNIPFEITDGGGAIFRGRTPEGFDLYELYGNDHEHYHKTKNGKAKTGVGIRVGYSNGGYANSKIVEGEGNQNSSTGELMLTTPDNIYFISKHNIKGFNPAKAVKAGMNPMQAVNIQENIKDAYNISDSGNTAKYGRSCKRKLANGGRVKFEPGGWTWGDVTGLGIGALGNIGGAFITNYYNNKARNYLTDAYRERANVLTDAYSQMHGIDLNSIKREDYMPEPIIAALQDPRYDVSAQLSDARRMNLRRRKAIKNNSLSSASMLNRLSLSDSDLQDSYGRIYEDKYNKENAVKRENVKTVNEINSKNAELKSIGLRDYSNAKLNLLRYNNDINNSKIAAIAEAKGSSISGIASVNASTNMANASTWANALGNIGTSVGNAFTTVDKRRTDYRTNLASATTEGKVDLALMNNDTDTLNTLGISFAKAIADGTAKGETAETYKALLSRIDSKLGTNLLENAIRKKVRFSFNINNKDFNLV